MKKIFIVFTLMIILSGCQLITNNDNYENIKSELRQEMEDKYKALNQEALDELEIKIRKELIDQYGTQLTEIEKMILNVVETQKAAVLGVSNFQKLSDDDNYLREVSTGSGVIYKYDETENAYYVITNEHVVEDNVELSVVLPDATYIDATLIGSDKKTDLAVVKFISDRIFPVVEIADSDDIKPGQFAIAIGNPLGYEYYGSVTFGVVSGLARDVSVDYDDDNTIDFYMTLIQHDVSINPGNSGGPLFDMNGKLIGINNMKSIAADVDNIGFAIPANTVKKISSILETEGKVVRPSLGIIGKTSENSEGVIVTEIVANASASYSNLKVGDIIIKYNDVTIADFYDLRIQIDNALVGDTVTLKVKRGIVILDITFTLIEAPELG